MLRKNLPASRSNPPAGNSIVKHPRPKSRGSNGRSGKSSFFQGLRRYFRDLRLCSNEFKKLLVDLTAVVIIAAEFFHRFNR